MDNEGCRLGMLDMDGAVDGATATSFPSRYAIADLLTQLKSSLGRNRAFFFSHGG